MRLYGIVGTGGCAREVMSVAVEMLARERQGIDCEIEFVGIASDERNIVNGHKVMAEEIFLSHRGKKFFSIAISDSLLRKKIAEKFIARGATPFTVRAPSSISMEGTLIGEGAILCPFSMVTCNVTIGKFFHANIYSSISHDCVIGDYVTLAPNAHCNGGVIIEDHVYIGASATIRQGTREKPIIIGRNAVIGMGAVVTKSVPPFSTVAGNPAIPLVRKG